MPCFKSVMEWAHPSQTMNNVFSKYIQINILPREKILIIYLGRSHALFQVCYGWTHPSQTMNKAVFSK